MEPSDEQRADDLISGDRLTADGMDKIGNPLAVVRGYIQLLQRRLHRGKSIDDTELMRVLDIMEEASRSVIDTLAAAAEPRLQGSNHTRQDTDGKADP